MSTEITSTFSFDPKLHGTPVMYRRDSDKNLVPWVFFVDKKTQEIYHETQWTGDIIKKVGDARRTGKTEAGPLSHQELNLRKRGFQYEKVGGELRIQSIPQREKDIVRLMTSLDPSPIPGVEDLRKQYHEELKTVTVGSDCPSDQAKGMQCAKSKVIKKWRDKFDAVLTAFETPVKPATPA
jgi:hypothetical protein